MKGKVLQSIFLFFARYPEIEGVIKNFTIKTGSDGYQQFKQEATTLPIHSIFPEIGDYIFGIDEEAIKKKLEAITGLYMFIDYGAAYTTTDNLNVKTDELDIAITIAKPNRDSLDPISQLLEIDNMLSLISKIRDDIRKSKDDPFVKMLSFPNDIVPFDASQFDKSYGWTLVFKISGVDII